MNLYEFAILFGITSWCLIGMCLAAALMKIVRELERIVDTLRSNVIVSVMEAGQTIRTSYEDGTVERYSEAKGEKK